MLHFICRNILFTENGRFSTARPNFRILLMLLSSIRKTISLSLYLSLIMLKFLSCLTIIRSRYSIGTLYKTISTNFSNVKDFDYDILVFYSPSGIKSLKENFPGFVQGDIKIAAFGPTTACAVEHEGLRLDINAPNPKAPSMTMALDEFLKEHNKNSR